MPDQSCGGCQLSPACTSSQLDGVGMGAGVVSAVTSCSWRKWYIGSHSSHEFQAVNIRPRFILQHRSVYSFDCPPAHSILSQGV